MSCPNETSYCQIHISGTEMTVRLRPSLLERLAAEVEDVFAATGRESGGILLGSVSGKALVIQDYDPVPSRHLSDPRIYLHSDVDRGRMGSAVALWSPNGESRLRAIGFYRHNARPALVASEEERRLYAQELKGASSVLLLVEPAADGRMALACYFAEQGQIGREGRLEIDLKKPEAPVVELPAAPVPGREEKPQIAPAPPKRASSALARVAVISSAAALLWVGFLQYQILQGMSAEASPAQRPAVIGLEVRPQGPYWHVSWNPSSEMLSGAARGHLRIEDGMTRKEVDLDAVELRTTSIIYDPAGNEISLHLELYGADGGRSAAESLHVFAKLPPAQAATRSRAEPAHDWSEAQLAGETGQPNSLR